MDSGELIFSLIYLGHLGGRCSPCGSVREGSDVLVPKAWGLQRLALDRVGSFWIGWGVGVKGGRCGAKCGGGEEGDSR